MGSLNCSWESCLNASGIWAPTFITYITCLKLGHVNSERGEKINIFQPVDFKAGNQTLITQIMSWDN